MSIRFSLAATLMLTAISGGAIAYAAPGSADGLSLGVSAVMAETPFATRFPAGQTAGYSANATETAAFADDYLAFGQNSMSGVGASQELIPGVSIDVGYNLDPTTGFDVYGGGVDPAFAHLLVSAETMNSPEFTTGTDYVGSTVALSENLQVRFGESMFNSELQQSGPAYLPNLAQFGGLPSLYEPSRASTSLAGVNWDLAPWASLGVFAMDTREQDVAIGSISSNPLGLAKSAGASSVGVSAHIGFGGGWVTTIAYKEGVTQLDLKSSALTSPQDAIHSQGYSLAIAKHGIFGDNDTLDLAIARPMQIYAGVTAQNNAYADLGTLDFGHDNLALASGTPETDLELGYVTTFMDGALALQANAGYQMNVGGIGGANGVAVISRAKINF